jgi:hypothetical protein
VPSLLTGKAQIPRKGAALAKTSSKRCALGNRVGPGSLSGPADPRELKILLSKEDKVKANHLSAISEPKFKIKKHSHPIGILVKAQKKVVGMAL